MLQFDERTARFLEDAYQGSDVVRRRLANLEALGARRGQAVLDLGCGPGLLTLELARAVGETGSVTGIDPSADMRAKAEARCAGRSGVRIADGTAASIPARDEAFDGAVSLQVFEYLDDIPGALAELHRVLRPGARLVIGDWHWDSWVWASDDPDRMRRAMVAWDRHLADRCVPERLPHLLREAGFAVEAVRPLTVVDTELRPDGVAQMMLILIGAYLRQTGAMEEAEIAAWADEQEHRVAEGRFFLSITHFVISAIRG